MVKNEFSILDKFISNSNLILFIKLVPIFFFVSLYFFQSPPLGLSQQAWTTVIIFLIAAYMLSTEITHMSITAIIIIFMLFLTSAVPASVALYGLGSKSFFLIFIGFLVAIGMEASGLDERVAHEVLKYCHTERSVILGVLIITAGLSMIMSNTTTVIMMLPIIKQITSKTNLNKIAIYLSIAFGANVGGVGFLIGTPPNVIAAEALGFGFLEWLRIGFPFMLIMIFLLYISFLIYFKPKHEIEKFKLKHLGPWSRKEKIACSITILTVVLWLTSFLHSLSTITVGLIGGVLMFLFVYDWKFFQKQTDWGVLILLAGTVSLGKALETTGAATWVAEKFLQITGFENPLWIAFAFVLLAMVITQFISNTATAGILTPVLIGISATIGVRPEVLVIPMVLIVSMTFLLPPGTAPNALVYNATGISVKEFIKAGILPTIFSIIAVFFYCIFMIV
ncbi:SLC13/DASS family transporter [Candidatus Woesearchaeota archaeon]|jgi:solute carrier family 13 (sodium-dependent dicarboxylate transporter), member 2/3/5|nr:SLC13/DASS family transporter [Candidatus Woesearchaeota archaeon]